MAPPSWLRPRTLRVRVGERWSSPATLSRGSDVAVQLRAARAPGGETPTGKALASGRRREKPSFRALF
ncbi:Hypothetical predicted protein [Marmota monax]|uniref:Uncharacterized protein n=1 Tax=Marmota monax TaxID=9995 RepID=A0A5E4D7V6_MARMO|nr:hypothetical protein GHT09_018003 [Marmota monax]VTJ90118.1 Hypothetical predicted protein [Marmota monax]